MKKQLLILLLALNSARGFTVLVGGWAQGLVVFEANIPPYTNVAALEMAQWAKWTNQTQLFPYATAGSLSSSDQHNTIAWSADAGWILPDYVLAATINSWVDGVMTEADTVVNSAQNWSSYDGPLIWGNWDIGRVLLHELGHCVGLDHSVAGTIMAPAVGDAYQLTRDDIVGAAFLYGTFNGAAIPPCPTCPTADPCPSPPPDHRLTNISTRGWVGVGDNVMIAGFIVKGNESVVVRAMGPTLKKYNVADFLERPSLEIHGANGQIMGANGTVPASLQPADPNEQAVGLNLADGAYTAIVRGVNSTQGIALVEVYEQ